MNTTTNAVRIIDCTSPTELFHHYTGQSEAQPAYIELDLRARTLLADYDAETGNARPAAVWHGFERRYSIPVLTGQAANRVMREIAPLAERVLADWAEEWDGQNTVAVLGDDAQAAEAEILDKLGANLGYGDIGAATQGFDDEDLVAQWDIDAVVNGSEAEEYGITADTTDERLEEIAQQLLGEVAGSGGSPAAVCHGLVDHLRSLRAEAGQDTDD